MINEVIFGAIIVVGYFILIHTLHIDNKENKHKNSATGFLLSVIPGVLLTVVSVTLMFLLVF